MKRKKQTNKDFNSDKLIAGKDLTDDEIYELAFQDKQSPIAGIAGKDLTDDEIYELVLHEQRKTNGRDKPIDVNFEGKGNEDLQDEPDDPETKAKVGQKKKKEVEKLKKEIAEIIEANKTKLWRDRLCDPETEWWGLLETAREIVRICLGYGDRRVIALATIFRSIFSRTAQEVKKYLAEDLTKHPSFTPAMRDSLVKDFGAYVERVWRWMDKSVEQGKPLINEFKHLEHERYDFYGRIMPYREDEESGDKSKQKKKAGQGETDNIAIEDKELTILTELAEGSDKTYSQVEIEAATSIPRGTIKDKLPRLESKGLVHRPLGKRKGYQITDKGREVVHRNE
jgi:DNA-binding MarR family transcriptional regulator